jgi:hypothetical protein
VRFRSSIVLSLKPAPAIVPLGFAWYWMCPNSCCNSSLLCRLASFAESGAERSREENFEF